MRLKSVLFLLFAGTSVAIAACTTPVDLQFPGTGTQTPTATTPITPTPTAVASAAPIDTSIAGVVNQCWVLEDVGGGGYPQVFASGVDTDRQLVLASDGSGVPGGSSTMLVWQVVGVGSQDYQRVVVRHTGTLGGKIHVTLEDEDPEGAPVQFRAHYNSVFNRHAQACTFPRWANVTVVGKVTALPWSEVTRTGGIVAFEATGTVTANSGGVDVSGQGFRGGLASAVPSPTGPCGDPVRDASSAALAGSRGVGIVSPALAFGNSNSGNGGGGGSCRDFGGGGGGGGGKGGDGGDSATEMFLGGGGRGGAAIDVGDRFVMGGGGGAGHNSLTTNAEPATAGGNGGGVVWIIALNYLDDVGQGIRANGATVESGTAAQHGLGGGGGGGTVRLDSVQNTTVSISASGANGGSSPASGPCGVGGGGGGGRIIAPVSASRSASPGATGLCQMMTNADLSASEAGIITEP